MGASGLAIDGHVVVQTSVFRYRSISIRMRELARLFAAESQLLASTVPVPKTAFS